MRILPVQSDHLPALAILARDTFTETFGPLYCPTDLETFLVRSYAIPVLVAETSDPAQFWRMAWDDHDQAVGYLQCGPVSLPHPEADGACQGELKRIYVRASHQGHGLGKALLELGLDWMYQRYGPAPQWIGVYCDNLKAQAIYASYGFVRVGGYQFPVGGQLDDEFILRRKP